MKRWLKVLIIIIGIIAALLLIINFAAGPIAKNYVNKHSKELCGRTVTIQKVTTNIFAGKVKILGFDMLEDNDKDSFCAFDTLIVRINVFKLLSNEVKLNEITLVAPDVAIIQNEDAFNFDSLIDFYTTDEEEEEEEEESNWIINLNNITLRRGDVTYDDIAIGSHFGMDNLQLAIPHIYFSGANTDVGLNLDFADGGKLGLQVAYEIEQGLYDLNVNLADFSLSPVLPYLKEYFKLSKFDGKLTTDISIKGSIEHILNIVANGNVSLDKIKMLNLKGEKVISADNISIDIENIDVEKSNFVFNSINIDGVETEYVIYDSIRTNLDDLFVESSEEETGDVEEESDDSNMNLLIKSFKLDNSNISYIDHSLREEFTLPISKINVTANNLNLTNKFDAKLQALVGDKGEIKGTFAGSLVDLSNMKLNIILKNLKLKDFSPYCVHYTAYPITDGLLSFTSINVIKDNYLTSSNEVNILNCTVDKKIKGLKAEYSSIPLKAGLYILSDRNKKISIDLPVTGNIDDPQFKLGKIIWKTFCNLIVKIATSPFDAMKKGGTEDVFKDMYMDFNDRSFTVENYQQLNKLSESLKQILEEKPDMKFSIQQSLDKMSSINSIALFKLKTEYYLSSKNKTIDQLTIEDYKAIQAIRDKDNKLEEFGTNKLGEKRPNIGETARLLYEYSILENEYLKSNERCQNLFKEYFLDQDINISKITFKEIDETSSDRSRVTIKFGVDLPDNIDDTDGISSISLEKE